MKLHPFAIIGLSVAIINHFVDAFSVMLGKGSDPYRFIFGMCGYIIFCVMYYLEYKKVRK